MDIKNYKALKDFDKNCRTTLERNLRYGISSRKMEIKRLILVFILVVVLPLILVNSLKQQLFPQNPEPNMEIVIPTNTPTPIPTTTPEPTKPSDKLIADMIKSKNWDYSIAIRLAKSENFWNKTKSFDCARVGGINSDGSWDTGLFQINSIHARTLAKYGWTLEDMKDCKKNIEFAYNHIYKSRGWSAWSAYNNKSYLAHSESIN